LGKVLQRRWDLSSALWERLTVLCRSLRGNWIEFHSKINSHLFNYCHVQKTPRKSFIEQIWHLFNCHISNLLPWLKCFVWYPLCAIFESICRQDRHNYHQLFRIHNVLSWTKHYYEKGYTEEVLTMVKVN
jgi:hypothetical protein